MSRKVTNTSEIIGIQAASHVVISIVCYLMPFMDQAALVLVQTRLKYFVYLKKGLVPNQRYLGCEASEPSKGPPPKADLTISLLGLESLWTNTLFSDSRLQCIPYKDMYHLQQSLSP